MSETQVTDADRRAAEAIVELFLRLYEPTHPVYVEDYSRIISQEMAGERGQSAQDAVDLVETKEEVYVLRAQLAAAQAKIADLRRQITRMVLAG